MVMMRQGDNVWESTGWITMHYVSKRSLFNVQNSIKNTISSYFMKLDEHVLRMLRKKYTKLQRSECATSISPLLLI